MRVSHPRRSTTAHNRSATRGGTESAHCEMTLRTVLRCGGCAARALRVAILAAMLPHICAARTLLQGGGGGLGSSMTVGPGGQLIGAGGAAGSFISQMMNAMQAGELLEFLVFDELKSAFLVQELITVTDSVVAFSTFKDTSTGTVVVTPGDVWKDLASGVTLQMGVSGLFYVNTAANLNGTIPKVGVSIPVVTVEGKVNVPARRRQLLTTEQAVAEGAGASDAAEVEVTLPTQRTATADPVTLAALTRAGFWDAAAAVLPPALRANFTALLRANAAPESAFLARHNISGQAVDAAHAALAALAVDGVTIQQPQFPNVLQTAAIPFLDVQLSFTILNQLNQVGANVRVTPFAVRVGANGQLFQAVKVVPFLSAFAQTTKQQLASSASAGLAAVAGLLQGNTTQAADFAQAQAMIFDMQTSPLPTALTISFDVLIRAQLQVNGGDIATIL